MDKKNTVTIRLTDEQFGWLRALSRRSKRSQSEVVRSLIEHGTVRERITRENLDIYNPQIQISAESETKRSIFRKRDKTKRSKKESAQHSKSRNKSFVMTSVSAL